jgi:hypothetical protein
MTKLCYDKDHPLVQKIEKTILFRPKWIREYVLRNGWSESSTRKDSWVFYSIASRSLIVTSIAKTRELLLKSRVKSLLDISRELLIDPLSVIDEILETAPSIDRLGALVAGDPDINWGCPGLYFLVCHQTADQGAVALASRGILTLADVTKYTANELLNQPGFGPASLKKLRAVLKTCGLHLAGEYETP